jgi:hypothetical protein
VCATLPMLTLDFCPTKKVSKDFVCLFKWLRQWEKSGKSLEKENCEGERGRNVLFVTENGVDTI